MDDRHAFDKKSGQLHCGGGMAACFRNRRCDPNGRHVNTGMKNEGGALSEMTDSAPPSSLIHRDEHDRTRGFILKRCLFIRGPAGAGFCRADGFSLAVQIESPASRRSFWRGDQSPAKRAQAAADSQGRRFLWYNCIDRVPNQAAGSICNHIGDIRALCGVDERLQQLDRQTECRGHQNAAQQPAFFTRGAAAQRI